MEEDRFTPEFIAEHYIGDPDSKKKHKGSDKPKKEKPAEPDPDSVAYRIRSRRMELSLTQAELAAVADVTAAAICKYELGQYKPKGITIQKLADALSTSPGWILYGENYIISDDLRRMKLGMLMRCTSHRRDWMLASSLSGGLLKVRSFSETLAHDGLI